MKRFLTAFVAAASLSAVFLPAEIGFAHHPTTKPKNSAGPAPMSPAERVLTTLSSGRSEKAFSVYLTGYSYWDNTPPGSSAISKPVIHRRAGGTGKYSDPITIAVGHTIIGSRQTLDFKPGTKFYIKRLRKYAIVEDVCGDGRKPQNGPCHSGHKGYPWLDIYVGGRKSKAGFSTNCARKITAVQQIIINPKPDYPVEVGEITETGCKVYRSS